MRDAYLRLHHYGKSNKRTNELIHGHLTAPTREERTACLERLLSLARAEGDEKTYEAYRRRVGSSGFSFTDIEDEAYPERLREIYDPPLVLIHQGNLGLLGKIPCAAIVGSRKCSNYGRRVAYDFAKRLASCGVAVISGMAYGIDASAHKGALDGGGVTAAVMGTGIDRCYPASNRGLHREIAKEGILLSEFKLGAEPMAHHFPRRNRIISGLSDVVIVIEAGLESGALITADFALNQGREVFAVPSGILGAYGKGSNALIKQGAGCLTDVDEILEVLLGGAFKVPEAGNGPSDPALDDIEEQVLALIREEGPVHADRILEKVPRKVHEVKAALMTLVLYDRIFMEPGDKYCIRS